MTATFTPNPVPAFDVAVCAQTFFACTSVAAPALDGVAPPRPLTAPPVTVMRL